MTEADLTRRPDRRDGRPRPPSWRCRRHGVLDAEQALIAPFAQTTDLSYLFGSNTAMIEAARSVLKERSDVIALTAGAIFEGQNSQTFGTYAALASSPACRSPPSPRLRRRSQTSASSGPWFRRF